MDHYEVEAIVPKRNLNSQHGTKCVEYSSKISEYQGTSPMLDGSERSPRNSSWQGARSTPVVGQGLELHTGDSTFQFGEIPRRDDRWRHHLSPPPQFCYGTGWEGNILQSPALEIQPTRLSDNTDLTSTFSVCTRRVFGGIGHRKQAFRSEVLYPNH
ncbi:hypothetical protein TNCV_5120571 [Trichonephila clavipes]|nr:hypothetical protein TNCV_5120571 [Trichonephila clavipes]